MASMTKLTDALTLNNPSSHAARPMPCRTHFVASSLRCFVASSFRCARQTSMLVFVRDPRNVVNCVEHGRPWGGSCSITGRGHKAKDQSGKRAEVRASLFVD